jgi:hypothetical protein
VRGTIIAPGKRTKKYTANTINKIMITAKEPAKKSMYENVMEQFNKNC